MTHAYVDSSWAVAIIVGEPGADLLQQQLETFDKLHASPLLEAEVFATMTREKLPFDHTLVSQFSWTLPDRPLTREVEQVLNGGYVRGADCWHLATALYLSPNASELTFLTLDVAQRKVARTLGFVV